jgi:2,3-dihydroxybenzoate-AMP ligase/mycobactin salicyl-AMP ligase
MTTIADLIDHWAATDPDTIALVGDQVRLTRAALLTRVNDLAAAFIQLGLAKGETVLLQLPNWPEYIYSYFALQKIGAVPVLLIAGHRRAEIDHLCRLTHAAAWIVPQLYRNADYRPCIASVKESNPHLRHVISVRAAIEDPLFSGRFEDLLANGPDGAAANRIAARSPKPTDVAHILPSGGTTGLPKAIPRTHADYLCNVKCLHEAGAMTSKEACLVAVPVGHNLALLNVVGAALVGYRLVLLDSTRPDDICRAVESERVTYMPTVPSLLKRVLDFERFGDFDCRSLRKISAGGEPIGPDLVERVRRTLGCTLIVEFGMSEGPLCRTRLDHDYQGSPGTVGTPICADDEFRILDDAGRPLPPDIEGELAARGPGIFRGYLKSADDNARAFTADGFFRTGDLARIDRRGNVTITGRIKDVINRGGEKISPAQIEKLLLTHPEIADAAVVGMPDAALGEKICAYVRPAPGATLDYETIKAFMESAGASKFLMPDRVEFLMALPLTQAGKHDKRLLRQDIQQKLAPTITS